ncbi:TIR domain-containing protein [Nocardia sp. NPDC057455]|uniref:nSTAND1 domain-containing NTPase n=1 Tax=Nocardia sp. NPDC057455 TaxID=3346138 RepID=UPI003671CED7
MAKQGSMSRIFISHSDKNKRQSIALKQWMIERNPGLKDEIFLDLDREYGIAPGQRWKQALRRANSRCEAVICLLSRDWEKSPECIVEYRAAEDAGKYIFCVRLEPLQSNEITAEWQRCDLFGDGEYSSIAVDDGDPIIFSTDGLLRLERGLRLVGIGAEYFPWPPPGDPDRAPYRGWRPFDPTDAAVYFGRDGQIVRAMDALRQMRAGGVESLFVILGPSGAGKSSFLRAGLWPRILREDRHFLVADIMRPSSAPISGDDGLAEAICSMRARLGLGSPVAGDIKSVCMSDVDQLRILLMEAQEAAVERVIDAQQGAAPPTIILPVDQAEELFAADAGTEADRFLELIVQLCDDVDELVSVIVVFTIRSDRFDSMQQAAELATLRTHLFEDVKRMSPARLREVIVGPASRASAAGRSLVVAEDLVDRLLMDAAVGGDTLPLLSLTLSRLHRDYGANRRLRLADYEAMGGMSRVVGHEIDEILSKNQRKRRGQVELLRSAFIPWLVAIGSENEEPTRRVARWSDLPSNSRSLINRFVDQRLLVKDVRNGEVVVEIALESLIRQWDELSNWVREYGSEMATISKVERAAEDWRRSNGDAAWLLSGTRLAEAEQLAKKSGFRARLNSATDFLSASRVRADKLQRAVRKRELAELETARAMREAAERHSVALRKRLRLIIAAFSIVAGLAVFAGVLFVRTLSSEQEAQARFREATALRLISEAESMIAGTRPGGTRRAVHQLLAAYSLGQQNFVGPFLNALTELRAVTRIVSTTESVSLAFSPDGRFVANGSSDRTVHLWDIERGEQSGSPLTGHTRSVGTVAFSPDGRLVVSGSDDETVRVWDSKTGHPVGGPLLGHTNSVTAVRVSPDSKRVVSVSYDNTIRLWDIQTGQAVGGPLTAGNSERTGLLSVAFSSDGQRIVTGGNDGIARIWDLASGEQIAAPLYMDRGTLSSVAFSHDSRLVAAGSDGSVAVWDVDSGKLVAPIPAGNVHQGWVRAVAFSLEDRYVVSGGTDGAVRVWDAKAGTPIGSPLAGPQDWVIGVSLASDGRILTGSKDGTVVVRNPEFGDMVESVIDHLIAFRKVLATSPDGGQVASGDLDGWIHLTDTDSGKPVGLPIKVHDDLVLSIAFDPGMKRLMSVGIDGKLCYWDLHDGGAIATTSVVDRSNSVTSAAFSKDGRSLAIGYSDGTVQRWDPTSGKAVGTPYKVDSNGVVALAFSSDHRYLASAGGGFVRVLDTETGKFTPAPRSRSKSTVLNIAFSPDGRKIVIGDSDGGMKFVDAATGEFVGPPLQGHTFTVMGLEFNADGRYILSAGEDHTIRVWDSGSGYPIGDPIRGRHGSVVSAVFARGETKIVAGNQDATVSIWPGPAAWPTDACMKVTRDMSRKDWDDWISPDLEQVDVCPS